MPKKKAESPIKPENKEIVQPKPRLTWRERRRTAQQSQKDAKLTRVGYTYRAKKTKKEANT